MRPTLLMCLLVMSLHAFSQITEDFTDGDFTNNPAWSGDITAFEIESGQLNSNGPDITETLHLSTPNSLINYTEWTFLVDMRFAPSGSNKTRTYLVSDAANLEGNLNGYYIQIGQSGNDEIDFYRQTAGSSSLLFTGTTQFTGDVIVRVKVTRDALGTWSIFADPTGGVAFASEGDDFVDNTHTSTSYFGFVAFHTKTNKYNFYFDDVSVAAFDPPFGLASVDVEGSQSLRLHFTQGLDATSAESVGNYTLSNEYATPSSALIDASNPDQVLLTFADDFSNNDYILTLNNINNADQDETLSEVEQPINIETATAFRDIVINEIYADFNPSATGLPDEEFIELLNTSDQAIKVENFSLNGNTVSDFTLESGAYVIVTDDSNLTEFEEFGDVVTMTSFPALTNGGMKLTLADNLGNVVDSLTYSTVWYQDEAKDDGGFTLEQINPERACNYSANWIASTDSNGGTPGQQNSAFDDSPDTANPNLISFEVADANTLELTFDEPMDEGALSVATYTLDQELVVSSITPSYFGVTLDVTPNLVSGTIYNLTITGATDCAGNALGINTSSLIYDIEAPVMEEVMVVSETELLLVFDEELDETMAEDENNYSIDNEVAPTLATRDEENPMQVTLTFETAFTDGTENSLTVSAMSDVYGNALTASLAQTFTYYEPFAVIDLSHESANTLRLSFNQGLDATSAKSVGNYTLSNGYATPSSALIDASNADQVLLSFADDFSNNDYILTLNNINNADQDETLSEVEQPISIETATAFRDIVINEIYADFNPSATGLPDEEFIELLNTSDQAIKVENFTLNGNTVSDFALESGAYVIVTDDSNLTEFEEFGDVVTMTSFPALTNGGMKLTLVDNLGNVVDSLTYSTSWYQDEEKDDGGFTLEQINPNLACNYSANWIASTDADGGTPGQQNSAFDDSPDTANLISFEIVDANTLELTFDEPMDEGALSVATYTLDQELVVSSITPSYFGVTLDVTPNLVSGTAYSLTVTGATDCAGNSLTVNTSSVIYDIEAPVLEEVMVVSETELLLVFDEELDETMAEEEDNYSVDNAIGVPNLATRDEENPMQVTLTFETAFTDGTENSLTVSAISDVYGNALTASLAQTFTYYEPFAVVELSQESANTLRLSFNQDLEVNTAQTLTNYSLNNDYGNPTSATLDLDNPDQVLLTFADDFSNNDYILTLNNINNADQDETLNEVEQPISIETATAFRDIVINEIYADFNPSAMGLPDEEFIELLNTSDQAIKVENFSLNGNALEDFTLESGAYVIVTDDSNLTEFEEFGDVVTMTSFPALTNGGMKLTLADNLENVVDSLTYSTSWYQDEEKDDGGFTLEQINPNLACNYSANWIASTDADGGTPGQQNSAFNDSPDETSPNLVSFEVADANTFELTFDEPMDEGALSVATYTLDQELVVSSITPSYFGVTLDVTPDFVSGTIYNLTITGATDCAGNALTVNTSSVIYDIEAPVLEEVIVVSNTELQLFFDEPVDLESLSENDFVVTPGMGSPSAFSQDKSSPYLINLHFDIPFIPEQNYKIISTNLSDQYGNISPDPYEFAFSYLSSLDTVLVMSGHHLLLTFQFPIQRETMLNPENYFLGAPKAVPISVFENKSNPLAVNLIFQEDFDDNKQLNLYAEGLADEEGERLPRSSVTFIYDTAPPKIDTLQVLDHQTLLCMFTEVVEQKSAETLDHYEYEDFYPVYAALDTDEKTVRLEFDNAFEPEMTYDLLVNEVADLFSNPIKTRIRESFVYDDIPPRLDSAYIKSPSEAVLFFHEPLDSMIAASTTHYYLISLDLEPEEVVVEREFQRQVTLRFDEGTFDGPHYLLEVEGLADQRGNRVTEPETVKLDDTKFRLSGVEILAADKIQLEFNHAFGEGFGPTNFQMENLEVERVESSDRFVTISLTHNMVNGELYTLRFFDLVSTKAQELHTVYYDFVFDSRLENAYIKNDQTIELMFETTFSAVQEGNFWLGDSTQPVASVVSSEDGHVVQLIFADGFDSDQIYTINWSALENEFGNNIPGYNMEVYLDRTSPTVVAVDLLDAQTISVQFSEPMDKQVAEFLGYYEADGLAIDQATYMVEDTLVMLSWSTALAEKEYTLRVHSVHDLVENQINDTTLFFTYEAPYLPNYGELIITEIMAAPIEDQVEYVELYNASDQRLELKGLVWKDGNDETAFVSGAIEPSEYIVISANESVFPDQNTGRLSSWLTLNNGGETLSIYAEEQLVFSTSYTDDWYGLEDHVGRSLEMLDVTNFCGEQKNWTGSQIIGGTPGAANFQSTENPDHKTPEIISAVLEHNQQLLVTWNEKLFPTDALLNQIAFDPSIVIASAELLLPESNSMMIQLLDELAPRQQYVMTVSDVTDCVGNPVSLESGQVVVQVPEQADSLDILINEILFNPETGGVDFVEIYNHSDKVIDLQNWMLVSGSGDNSSFKMITANHRLVEPFSFVVLTADPAILDAQYPLGDESTYFGMASFPPYNDSHGEVGLIDSKNQVMDYFEYSEDYHSSLLDSEEGVSLERIAYDIATNDPNSWHSAASTAFYATPGLQNSQYTETGTGKGQLVVEPKIFMPNTVGQDDFTTISYSLNQAGGFANIYVFDTHGHSVKSLAENQLLSTSGFVTWDGSTDAGDLAPIGYYIVFAEIYDPSGNKSVIKETVVLGARL
ncbi:lamin tail domain-containing protein [Reichenbachiella agariperforans]|uniref:lamin tail domain-containing protein n=1 Tax=Reichenbachiella agariperforans TaxID=156994 RepID=UPI001C09C181|nr:lamin tail domain-containing protein [Reichenbachiella agariperforans]MBU2915400.1 lamin tail domain-containing protein [Reichenbachiella agariperforans]